MTLLAAVIGLVAGFLLDGPLGAVLALARRGRRLPRDQRPGQRRRPPRGQRRRRSASWSRSRRWSSIAHRSWSCRSWSSSSCSPWSGSASPATAAPSANTPACACCARPAGPASTIIRRAMPRQEARPHLRRLAAHRHARTRRRRGPRPDLRRPARARRAGPRLRLQLPLGDPGRLRRDGHRRRRRPPLDQRHELVPPARAALRRVRLLARRDPLGRRLPGPLRPRLQHEPRPPQPRGRDPLREPRRRRRAHRLHAVPDLPRPPPPPGLPRRPDAPRRRRDPAQVPPPHLGPARALLRRPLREPRGALQVDLDPRRAATPTRPAARPSWSRTDAFDFLLFSLADNDNYSHRHGPEASVESISRADACFAELVEAAGGLDALPRRPRADPASPTTRRPPVDRGLPLAELLGREWSVLAPSDERPEPAQLAVSPTGRAAHVYLLPGEGDARRPRRGAPPPGRDRRGRPGLLAGGPRRRAAGAPRDGPAARRGDVAVVERGGEQLRFRPGGESPTCAAAAGTSTATRAALDATVAGRAPAQRGVPGPAGPRLLGALARPHAGDFIVSLAPGYEAVDWGGVSHAGGGSHGVAAPRRLARAAALRRLRARESPTSGEQWALRDVAPVVLEHFGL